MPTWFMLKGLTLHWESRDAPFTKPNEKYPSSKRTSNTKSRSEDEFRSRECVE